jgi:hypothetical protein
MMLFFHWATQENDIQVQISGGLVRCEFSAFQT